MGAAKADVAPLAARLSPTQAAAVARAVPAIIVATKPKPAIAFDDPLPGYTVNSPFGMRELSFEDRARVHEGVDIAAPSGEPIHATADGEVVATGLSSSYGNFVEVEHAGGVTSFYAHMSKTAGLKVGNAVAEGEVIGYVGSTGHSTGPHLHFEIRKDGRHFDPQMFMGRAFMTLASLPLVRSAETRFGNFKGRIYQVAERGSHGRVHARLERLALRSNSHGHHFFGRGGGHGGRFGAVYSAR